MVAAGLIVVADSSGFWPRPCQSRSNRCSQSQKQQHLLHTEVLRSKMSKYAPKVESRSIVVQEWYLEMLTVRISKTRIMIYLLQLTTSVWLHFAALEGQ